MPHLAPRKTSCAGISTMMPPRQGRVLGRWDANTAMNGGVNWDFPMCFLGVKWDLAMFQVLTPINPNVSGVKGFIGI